MKFRNKIPVNERREIIAIDQEHPYYRGYNLYRPYMCSGERDLYYVDILDAGIDLIQSAFDFTDGAVFYRIDIHNPQIKKDNDIDMPPPPKVITEVLGRCIDSVFAYYKSGFVREASNAEFPENVPHPDMQVLWSMERGQYRKNVHYHLFCSHNYYWMKTGWPVSNKYNDVMAHKLKLDDDRGIATWCRSTNHFAGIRVFASELPMHGEDHAVYVMSYLAKVGYRFGFDPHARIYGLRRMLSRR